MSAQVRRLAPCLIAGVVLLAVSGCESAKSSNPLSPEIAGPIPWVEISPPKPLEPSSGMQVKADQQPVGLLLENSYSTGPRPFWFEVQVASDSGFSNRVHEASKVEPGPDGRTLYRLPEHLSPGRTYYWRARALDGANTGPYSAAAHFEVLLPVVIHTPVPLTPVNGQTITGAIAQLVVGNGAVQGPAGQVYYRFEVAADQSFANAMPIVVPRDGGANTSANTPDLQWNTVYFWRVVATNGTIWSEWSQIQSFRTPVEPAVPPPYTPLPPPTGGGRTPDPAPGTQLPLPNMEAVVMEIAHLYPHALYNSCQHDGGTWEFMDRVVDRLRQYDTRWGYNWKRGTVGDPSLDVVDYHWGPGPDEDSIDVYIIDIIIGHCGPSPSPGWIDVTDVTYSGGSIGRWTGRGRF
jgi:hypothetical protein